MDTTILTTQLRNMILCLPSTLTIGSKTYSVVKTNLKAEKKLTEYGQQSDYKFSLIGVKADFTTMPTVNSKVTYASSTYRIVGIEFDPADVSVRFDLGGEYA